MGPVAKRLLLFAATTGYQIRVFADAARRLGADLTLATDRCHIMEDPWGDRAIAVKFDRVAESFPASLEASLEALRGMQFDGVAAVGDRPAMLAAEAAEMLGAPFHPPEAARACNDKYLARQLYRAAGLRVPQFFRAQFTEDPHALAGRAPYPCVLKPLGLSASRGVIRANNAAEFAAAFERIRKIGQRYLQVESYIPGREFAIEGLVTGGEFQPIAIFDKPDPLDGPFFEETIYVTPSREPEDVQSALLDTTARAVRALGLRHGPVHAELRHNAEGAWMLEAHARPIGGLCAKALRLVEPLVEPLAEPWSGGPPGPRPAPRPACPPDKVDPGSEERVQGDSCGPGGLPYEEIILRHALGEDVSRFHLANGASGVMMIPIPKDGVYRSVEGLEEASAGVEEIVVTATPGQRLIPLPEGSSYLGFIFARGNSPQEVEAALRQAHAGLRFDIATALETFRPGA
jgi:glutathione synthase/RimK-type ligase-like ATP-grasp enzyme